MISEARKKEWNDQIDFVLKYGDKIVNEWERDFISSVKKHLQSHELSFKQSSVLRKIAMKVSEKIPL